MKLFMLSIEAEGSLLAYLCSEMRAVDFANGSFSHRMERRIWFADGEVVLAAPIPSSTCGL